MSLSYIEKINLQNKFETSFRNDDVETIKDMLKEGLEDYPDINQKLSISVPVFVSLCENNVEMLNQLFIFGADLDVASDNGWHFSHELATKKNMKLVNGLIQHVELNRKTPEGLTPFMIAVKEDNWEVAEAFLNSKQILKVYSKDENQETVLHYLCKKNNFALLEKVIVDQVNSFEGLSPNKEGKLPTDYILIPEIKEKFIKMCEDRKSIFNNYIQDLTGVKIENNMASSHEEEKPKVMSGLGGVKRNF